MSHLLSDDAVEEGLTPTVTAILQARMPAPINLNALSFAADKTINETKISSDTRTANTSLISAPVLKEKIEALIAKNLPDILQPTQRLPDAIGADNWNALCRSLVLPSTFKLAPHELIERLQQIKEGGDAPHYIHYLKAIAHLQLAQHKPAADEMSQAIRLVPERSALWFTYSFRLSFLLAYVQRWDDYDKLCATALSDFKDDSDTTTLERLAKMCLFSKNSRDLDAALSIADKALTNADSIAPKIFIRLTKGIAEVRRRNNTAALEHLEFVSKYGIAGSSEGHRINIATANVYSAIALHSLGRQDEAHRKLAEAETGHKRFSATSGWWPDWMLASVVLKEARQLLDSPASLPPKPP